jgi:DNA-binding MarR family transcriptional regulator
MSHEVSREDALRALRDLPPTVRALYARTDDGLSPLALEMLVLLADDPAMGVEALGRRLEVDRRRVFSILGELRDHGLIEDQRDAPGDRRRVTARVLTAEGRRRLGALVRRAQEELSSPD